MASEPEPAKLVAEPVKREPGNVVMLPAPNPGPVARFMVDRIEAAPRGRVEVAALFSAYQSWCEANGYRSLPVSQFGDALAPVLEAVGIERKARGENVYLVGVKLAS